MSKKRKLNSKNPKYMDKSLVTEKKVIRREQIANVRGTKVDAIWYDCLLYTSPSPRDRTRSRMPSSA